MSDPRWMSLLWYRNSGPSEPEPRWPPPDGAPDWWDAKDRDVGTADFTSSYLWTVRIRLQVRIAGDDRIDDARCLVEDSEAANRENEALMSSAIVAFLKGKTLAESLAFDDPALWSPTMAIEATALALKDWALKGGSPRFDALPPFPQACVPYAPPLSRRLVSRIPIVGPFLRSLGF